VEPRDLVFLASCNCGEGPIAYDSLDGALRTSEDVFTALSEFDREGNDIAGRVSIAGRS
jgi:hypothetical protein